MLGWLIVAVIIYFLYKKYYKDGKKYNLIFPNFGVRDQSQNLLEVSMDVTPKEPPKDLAPKVVKAKWNAESSQKIDGGLNELNDTQHVARNKLKNEMLERRTKTHLLKMIETSN